MRHFYRCTDCLEVLAAEDLGGEAKLAHLRLTECPICSGQLAYMGKVQRGRLVVEETATPCDARCTSARGPNCDCQCGGENHGSERLVTVTRDSGSVPKMAPIDNEKARGKAEEYRLAVTTARARYEQHYAPELAARRGGAWVADGRFYEMRADKHVLSKAIAMKSHKGRIAALTNFLQPSEET